MLVVTTAHAEERWVYHFDPDTAPRNPGKFKAVVSAFLTSVDSGLKFQPFLKSRDFEKRVGQQMPAYLIVGFEYFKKNRARWNLKPLLMPARRGARTFRKVLVTRSADITTTGLAGKSVAATALDAAQSFKTLLGPLGVQPSQLRVVSVSKDVDALLALAFGQVDLALVRADSIVRLRKVNPNAVASLRTLYTTRPVFHPPLCEVGAQPATLTAALVKGLRAAGQSGLGRRTLRIMGFDAWTDLPREAAP